MTILITAKLPCIQTCLLQNYMKYLREDDIKEPSFLVEIASFRVLMS